MKIAGSPDAHLYRQWPETSPLLELPTLTGATYHVPPGAWVRSDLLTGAPAALRMAFGKPMKSRFLPIADAETMDGLPIIVKPTALMTHGRAFGPPAPPTGAVLGTRVALVATTQAQADAAQETAHVPFHTVKVVDADAVAATVRDLFANPQIDMVAVLRPGEGLPWGWLDAATLVDVPPEGDARDGFMNKEGVGLRRDRVKHVVFFDHRRDLRLLAPCRLGIVVTVFNRLDVALPCLRSIAAHTDPHHLIYVVDDCSTPEHSARLATAVRALDDCEPRQKPPTLHRFAENRGYREAANKGAELAFADGCDAVVFVNSDILVTPGWVDAMIRGMLPAVDGSYEGADLVNLHCNDAALISLPLAGHKIVAPWPRLRGGRSYLDVAATLRFVRPSYPTAVTSVGNCMLVTRRAWKAHGPFDALYGRGYGEECELWARVLNGGGRAVVADDGYVFHESHAGGMSTSAASASEQEKRGVDIFRSRHEKTWAAHAHTMSEWPQKTVRQREAVRQAKPTGLPVHFFAADLGSYGGAYCLMRLVKELREWGVNAQMGHLHEQTIALTPPYGPLRHRAEATMPADFAEAVGATHGVVVASHWGTGPVVRDVVAKNPGFVPVAFWQDREDLFTDAEGKTHLPEAALRAYVAIPNRVYNAPWVWQSALAPITVPKGANLDVPTLPIPGAPGDWAMKGLTRWIPVGVDCDLFAPAVRAPGPVRVLAMWRPHTPRRGARRLAEMFAILHRERPDLSLEVFGWNEKGTSAPPPYVKNHGLLSQRQVADLMARVHVVVEASDYQGFGLPGLEAMASGAALVSTDTMGVWAYADKEAWPANRGVHVVEHSPRALADGVIAMADDATEHAIVSSKGADIARRSFDWRRIGAQWVTYLAQLWRERGTDPRYLPGLERAEREAVAFLA
jgi:GT2 family glycosyltransferase/glycosyltransferase involved in cell wall biosynthesis